MKPSSLIPFPNALSMLFSKRNDFDKSVEFPISLVSTLLFSLFSVFFVADVSGQCTPNAIAWGYGGPNGSPFDYACGNESYHGINGISNPTGTGQTYVWEYSFNGGPWVTTALTTANISKANVTTAILGTNGEAAGYYLIRRIINDASPVCTNTSPTVVLYWADPPEKPTSAGAISPVSTTACITATGTLTLSGYTGPIHRWEVTSNAGSSWAIIANTENTYNYSLPTTGTYCYRALVDDICTGTVGVIDANDDYSVQACVTVNALPSIATPGTIAAVCFSASVQNASLAYSATTNNPTSYSINWDATANANGLADQANTMFAFMAGGGSINTIVVTAGALPGTYNGTMTIMNAINCTNTQAVIITIRPLPTITTTGTIDALCFNSGAQMASLTYTASANNPTSYSIDWNNTANSAGLIDQTSTVFAFVPGGGVLNTIAITAATPAGSYSGVMTILNANGCSNTVAVTITINPPATVNAGQDQTVCVDFPAVTLTGMIGGSATTSLWTTSGTGMFVNAMSPNTVYNPSAADILAGTVTLTLTTNDPLGPCNAVSDFLVVLIEDNCCVPVCPNDIMVECGDSTDPTETGEPTGLEQCGTITYQDVTMSGACPVVLIINRTWTSSTSGIICEQVITVEDNTAPSIDCSDVSNLVLECAEGSNYISQIEAWVTASKATILADMQTTDACDNMLSIDDDYNGMSVPSLSCSLTTGIVVTFTVSDDCNNSATCTKTVYLDDSTVPTIDCSGVNNLVMECAVGTDYPGQIETWIVAAKASILADMQTDDSCDGTLSIADNYNGTDVPALSCDLSDGLVITFTVTDDCNNSASCTKTVYLDDTVAPMITTEEGDLNALIGCEDGEELIAALAMAPTATDNCDATPTISLTSSEIIQAQCVQAYALIRKWVFHDDCLNESDTFKQTIVIVNLNLPEFTVVPQSYSIPCTQTPMFVMPQGTGGCGATPMITEERDTFPGIQPGSIIIVRTFSISDDCGNTNPIPAQQTITVTVDNIAPIAIEDFAGAISGQEITVSVLDNDSDNSFLDLTSLEILVGPLHGIASVNMDGTISYTPFANYTGADSLTYVICDDGVNCIQLCDTSVVHFAVAFVDAIPDSTTTCVNVGVTVDVLDNDVASNTLLDPAMLSIVVQPDHGTAVANMDGTITYTPNLNFEGRDTISYMICDTNDLMPICDIGFLYVTVLDNVDPEITCPMVTSPIECPAVPSFGMATATDVCDILVDITFVTDSMPGTCAQEYILTRTWTATDDAGNTSTCSVSITVQDNTAPMITTVAGALNATVECSDAAGITAALLLAPAATDNCDATPTISLNSDMTTPGACSQEYTRVRKWLFRDDCLNTSATFTQTITVQDNTAPVISTAALALDATLECDDLDGINAALALSPAATDNCDATPTISVNSDVTTPGACSQEYTRVRKWLFRDDCLNTSATFTQTITVQDNTAPVISTAALALDATLECDDLDGIDAALTLLPAATDNCDATPTISLNSDVTTPGACSQEYTRVRKWLFRDDCLNTSATFTQTITVQDNTAPVISTAALALDATLECDDLDGIDAALALSPAATDNCDATPTISLNSDVTTPGACSQEYTRVRKWLFRDDCLNTSATFTQTITVQDNTAPVISTAALALDATLECDDLDGIDAALALAPAATDNCDLSPTISLNSDVTTPGACSQEYTRVRKWLFRDDCLNTSATFTQTITVQDNTAPVISTAALALDATLECDDLDGINAALALSPAATDNCDATPTISLSSDVTTPGSCPQEYVRVRVWRFRDDCLNLSGPFTQTITIQDNTAPVITCPSNVTIECTQSTLPIAQNNIPLNGLMAWWPFNGNANDESSNGNNGSVNGSTLIADRYGSANQAYNFDGINDQIDIPNSASISPVAEITLSAWIFPTAFEDNKHCVSKGSHINYTYRSYSIQGPYADQKWRFAISAGGSETLLSSNSVAILNQWTHITVVYDGVSMKLFINGVLDSQVNKTGSINQTSEPLIIGSHKFYDPSDYWFNGKIDDIGIWDRVLTEQEILDVYDSGTGLTHAVDICDPNPIVNYTDVTAAGECPQEYTITRTWSATDACGNMSVCNQIITVDDSTAPNLIDPVVDCSSLNMTNLEQCLVDAEVFDPTTLEDDVAGLYEDNCGDVIVTFDPNSLVEDSMLVDQFTMTFGTYFFHQSPVLTSTKNYSMVITGTWKSAETSALDAAYYYCYYDCSGGSCDPNEICDPQLSQIFITGDLRPVNDVFKPTHLYYYNFIGEDLPLIFEFLDGGGYGDNSGSLNIQIFELSPLTSNSDCDWTFVYNFNVADNCGNTTVCSVTYAGGDVFPPTITCPNNVTIECSSSTLPTNTGSATAFDICDQSVLITYADVTVAGSCPQEYIIARTWFATDDCGNSATCSQSIIVEDNTAPVITIGVGTLDATLECSDAAGITSALLLAPAATDNCDATPTISLSSDVTTPGTCPQEYVRVRVWRFRDDCLNLSGPFTQTITIQDNTAPVITTGVGTLDATLECSDAAGITAALLLAPAATDNCDATPTLSLSSDVTTPGACSQEYSRVRKWLFRDDCLNTSAIYTQMINVEDTTPPSFDPDCLMLFEYYTSENSSCPSASGISLVVGQIIGASDPYYVGSNTVPALIGCLSDNCAPVESLTARVESINLSGDECVRTYMVTFTIIDPCGNEDPDPFMCTIYVYDDEAPALTCPINVSIECDESTLPANTGTPTATDDCQDVGISYSDAVQPGGCPQEMLITRTWVATDSCGNISSCVQMIDVEDTTPPSFDPDCLMLFEYYTSQTSSCPSASGISLVEGQIIGASDSYYVGSNTVPPLGACLSDNCAPVESLTARVESIILSGDECVRTYVVTFTIIDPCGNEDPDPFMCTIHVYDDVAPGLTCPADVAIECDESTLPANTGTATATDDCQDVGISYSDAVEPGGCPQEMLITRTWVATDSCGNSSSCVQMIDVEDTTPPSFDPDCLMLFEYYTSQTSSCPSASGISLIEGQIIGASDSYYVGSNTVPPLGSCLSDNCAPVESLTARVESIILSGDECVRTYVVTFTIIDPCGNEDPDPFMCTIHVYDNVAPELTCPIDVVIECDESTLPANTGTPIATDDCQDVGISYSDAVEPGGCPQEMLITRTWVATDSCGNISSCVQMIDVEDTTPPSFDPDCLMLFEYYTSQTSSCPSASGISLVEGQIIGASDSYYVGSNTVPPLGSCLSDNCAPVESLTARVESIILSGDECVRTYVVTFTIIDPCGNEDPDPFMCTIHVYDDVAPGLTCPADVAIECDESTLPANTGTATATDDCQDVGISYSDAVEPGGCPQEMLITRTWVATDSCGNSSSCVQMIDVEDTTPPSFDPDCLMLFEYYTSQTSSCPSASGISLVEGQIIGASDSYYVGSNIVPALGACLSDNCAPVSSLTARVESIILSGDECVRTYVVTFTIIDPCGNEDPDPFMCTIHVYDNVAPELTCPIDVVIECDESTLPANTGTPIATDDCQDVGISYSDSVEPGECPQEMLITRTWVATDSCGNSSSCVQMIDVEDTTPPSFDPDCLMLFEYYTSQTSSCPSASGISLIEGQIIGASDSYYVGSNTVPPLGACLSDNCAPVSSLTARVESIILSGDECVRTYVVTFTIIDPCGNEDPDPFMCTIHVYDDVAPELTCPIDVVIECDESTLPANTGTPIATDDCQDVGISYSDVVAPGGCPQEMLITRTWVATDSCGNSSSCVQMIDVEDTTPPSFDPDCLMLFEYYTSQTSSCPSASGISLIEGQIIGASDIYFVGSNIVPALGACLSDNCAPVSSLTARVESIILSGDECVRTYVVTFTIIDPCGNEDPDPFMCTIHVYDDVAPELTCPIDVVIECDESTLPANTGTPIATDDCQDVGISYSDAVEPGECPQEMLITRTWVATDSCGNSSSCVQMIDVEDTTPPSFDPDCLMLFEYYTSQTSSCPSASGISLIEGQIIGASDSYYVGSNTVPPLGACLSDNCAPVESLTARVESIILSGDECVRTYVVTFTIIDPCGNEDPDPFMCTIHVYDNVAPGLTCPADVAIECDESTLPANTGTATATDDCQDVGISYSDAVEPGECPQEMLITRTWVATDSCGNISSCVQMINVEDTTPPSFDPECELMFNYFTATGSSCILTSGISLVEGQIIGPQQTYSVGNNIIPALAGCLSDNCAPVDSLTIRVDDIELTGDECFRSFVVTFALIDPCGNEDPDPLMVNINLYDNLPPVVNPLADITIECDQSSDPLITGMLTAFDDCQNVGISFADTTAPGVCPHEIVISRTWAASDSCGNLQTYLQLITVEDHIAPSCATKDVTITEIIDPETGYILITPEMIDDGSIDNCGGTLELNVSPDTLFCVDEGENIITFTVTDECGNIATCTSTVTLDCIDPCVEVNTWVYLEGPTTDPSGQPIYTVPMRTTINNLHLLPGQTLQDPFFGDKYTPPGQPYNAEPWLYPGTEGDLFDSGGDPIMGDAGYPATAVDWVLVSVRADSAGTGGPLCQAAALVHNDGHIEFVQAFDCCDLDLNATYYIVVEHRNHLIVMSHDSLSVDLSNSTLTYDFRIQQSYLDDPFGFGASAQKEINPGIFAMFAGNGEQTNGGGSFTELEDTDINFNDRTFWEGENGKIGEYHIGDYNQNGDTNFNDRVTWERNNGTFSSVPRD